MKRKAAKTVANVLAAALLTGSITACAGMAQPSPSEGSAEPSEAAPTEEPTATTITKQTYAEGNSNWEIMIYGSTNSETKFIGFYPFEIGV